jgi:hypothetical protein
MTTGQREVWTGTQLRRLMAGWPDRNCPRRLASGITAVAIGHARRISPARSANTSKTRRQAWRPRPSPSRDLLPSGGDDHLISRTVIRTRCTGVRRRSSDREYGERGHDSPTMSVLDMLVTVDMIATGTDVKPLECVFFIRDV